jgi:hypothetical protein
MGNASSGAESCSMPRFKSVELCTTNSPLQSKKELLLPLTFEPGLFAQVRNDGTDN